MKWAAHLAFAFVMLKIYAPIHYKFIRKRFAKKSK